MARALTVKGVESAKPGPVRKEIPDGDLPGFYLVVQSTGRKSFAYRYRYGGKTKKLTIGTYPKLTLADVRALARDAERVVHSGGDPLEKKKAAKVEEQTVEQLCRSFIQDYAKEHTRERSWRETARYLGLEPDPKNEGELRFTRTKGEVISKWQQRPAKSVTGEEVIDLIRGIYARGAKISANRTLAAIRKMFAWAVAEKMLAASPCAGAKPPAKEKMRRRVLNEKVE